MQRVLLIDDEVLICELFATVLTMGGRYAVATGGSGSKLRALLGAYDDVVAIVCDHSLPGENGIDIQLALEPILRDRRIAFVLAHGAGPDLKASLPNGYFVEHQIVEFRRPSPHVMDIVSVVDAEVARLRS